MGVDRGPFLDFRHDTVNVFFNKHSLCENIYQLSRTVLQFFALVDVKLKRRDD